MNRRYFLKNATYAGAGSFMLAGLPIKVFGNDPVLESIARSTANDNVLILIQLHGGNDGLNCVVPLNQYATYLNLRPNIAIPNEGTRKLINLDSTLGIDDQVGIHPDMLAFKEMYDSGLSSVVPNVGFKDMNLSHFRGRDIMFAGGDSKSTDDSSGWMGRLMDYEYPGYPNSYPNDTMKDPIAMEIGNSMSLAFHTGAGIPIGFSIDSVAGFYELIHGVGVVPPILFPDSHAGEELRYLMDFEKKSNQYAARLKEVYEAGSNTASVTYPATYPYNAPATSLNNPLSGQLRLIARLLKGGCKTRIFMCRIGGFDTHANQVESYDPTMGTHAALIYHLFSATKAFYADLKGLGYQEKVMSMTFTEFGRRVRSNASYGSDHGTAFPMFLFGPGLRPGIRGVNANLSNLSSDNLIYSVDYRQVYYDVVKEWFGADAGGLAATGFDFKDKPSLGLFGTNSAPLLSDYGKPALDCFPNPASGIVNFSFVMLRNSQVKLTLFDVNGKKITDILNEQRFAGKNTVPFNVGGLPSGTYVYSIETNELKESRKLFVK